MKLSMHRLAVAALVVSAATTSNAALQFTDWTAANTGTIGSVGVSLAGSYINAFDLTGTTTSFSSAAFSPTLPLSDGIEIRGSSSSDRYSVTFSRAVVDPVLHFASLASTLTFQGVNPTRVSGDATFLVSGNTVSGTPSGSTDSNGTVRLDGVFTTFSFTAFFAPASGDGIAIQIGVNPVPEPGGFALGLAGLGAMAVLMRRRRLPS
jgi:uncharacterized protein (TIGR03382 family)